MSWVPDSPYNELPSLPPEGFIESRVIFAQLIKARVALSALKQTVNLIPNRQILLETLPVLEACSSSEIENIVTTTDTLFQYMDTDDGADPATKEALRYRKAIWSGIESLKTCPLSTRTMIAVCDALRDMHVGVRKVPGTYIGSSKSGRIIYTPPEGEKVILDKLDELSAFIHSDDDLDPLLKMAMMHYQFEAIHPFEDGNGRTGRVINILYLIEQQLLDEPVLYLSKYIIEHKPDYYRALLGVTRDGKWEDWILFMLSAVEVTASWTCAKVKAIVELANQTSIFMKSVPELKPIYSHELVEIIFKRPYCRISNLVEEGIAKRQTAMKYLKTMSRYGIVNEMPRGREHLFINIRLRELLADERHEFRPFDDPEL